jgi:CheY-like chemotaxis protein
MKDKQRILIVDDEPQTRRVLRGSLTERGYDVRVAADDLDALQIFGNWPPDLVVTDPSFNLPAGVGTLPLSLKQQGTAAPRRALSPHSCSRNSCCQNS